jgi:hypothetical protein
MTKNIEMTSNVETRKDTYNGEYVPFYIRMRVSKHRYGSVKKKVEEKKRS